MSKTKSLPKTYRNRGEDLEAHHYNSINTGRMQVLVPEMFSVSTSSRPFRTADSDVQARGTYPWHTDYAIGYHTRYCCRQ